MRHPISEYVGGVGLIILTLSLLGLIGTVLTKTFQAFLFGVSNGFPVAARLLATSFTVNNAYVMMGSFVALFVGVFIVGLSTRFSKYQGVDSPSVDDG